MRTPVVKGHPIAALVVISLSVFVISVDATIVNVALPTLSRELNADTAQLQWIVDAYTLVMSGLLLSAGSLSDRYGRRGWLSGGLALFAITSAVAAQLNSANALIAGRAAMGVGAAVIFPTTLGLITNIFTDPVNRAKAIGVWAGMVGVGVAAGPMAGGWLLEHYRWGSIFLVNVPVAAVAIIGGVLVVPTSRDPAAPPVDVPGLLLSAIGVTAVVHTVIEAPNWGWTSTRTAAGFAAGAVVLTGFALWERRVNHPMLHVSVFANRRFSGGSLAVTAGFLTLFGFIFVITQYFQFIKAYSAFETGVRLLPVAAAIAVGSVLGPRLVEKIGSTTVVAGGLAIFAMGLSWASTADAGTPYLQIAMQMLLLGGGLGFTFSPATEAIMGSLGADQAGVGSAVNDTTRELGGALGVAIVGSVFASVYAARLASSPVISALPAQSRSTMQGSMAAAEQVIKQLPTGLAATVRSTVTAAFLDGLQVGSLVCAGLALGAAAVVAVLLPPRARQTATVTSVDKPEEVRASATPNRGAAATKGRILHPRGWVAPALPRRGHRPGVGADAHRAGTCMPRRPASSISPASSCSNARTTRSGVAPIRRRLYP
ncbi:MFS transporter [Mycobacterium shinjukuense]|uniref:MFS transporter n=1 Tax=Mycobacterium shinjukuense TaxID=398694 RepID=A0A7I7MK81_9MYCO|nr:MFS transporter [Mycobacterium shinjukuense]BBX72608.1 MFS transporter [Mycobacterium shinjukuense]